MNIILMGPPGAGKGTQAELLKARFPIPHISTGDIFRDAVNQGSELGQEAQKYMSSGQLVPDEITTAIVKERITQADCDSGFLLDGFPRTTDQAQALDQSLAELGKKVDLAINIDVPTQLLIERLSGRISCRECKRVYNLNFNPPREQGKCDSCGGELVQRNDDRGETVVKRLEVYNQQTRPLLQYYEAQGVLFNIEGSRGSGQVFADIQEKLESL
ncbi:adenylate kinase [Syntrophomonas wolfei]|jgi:adenylate kinase|uniref:Adenylate kinase n=1 Tax=Syntrophomonas wolfei subsp. wolfei (strain DSM 2245B / Goettingen) TaxID=335541 RepID=KAD_SYNWW|nr:adenylate kinase [Syntrophomonas wolfei]Q0AUK1.1 RecName: Full=Adenylate kinase; Short=AK; AltName: Full=ATP-AMP transphosphorylase; AltName: Full=ATP:AMP phosphotransferase; AltName: Full=Adenylate monophosphate kinase [Syntrophomonas wolfei subsp. wolfei str. Goettingen G311]ABI69603.1 Adenylate kinase [Syntrophomonas wolfei subsp. wolfei str. Goettingen G311]